MTQSGTNHEGRDELNLRYVYMLLVENYGRKRYWGKEKIFYTGQTCDIVRRTKEHISGVGSKFLSNYFPDSRKILVFVDYVLGTEAETMKEEKKIKKLSPVMKEKLIQSERNKLVKYIPLKAV